MFSDSYYIRVVWSHKNGASSDSYYIELTFNLAKVNGDGFFFFWSFLGQITFFLIMLQTQSFTVMGQHLYNVLVGDTAVRGQY